MNIETIPEDCLTIIFGFLPIETLRDSILVCKKWKRLTIQTYFALGNDFHRRGFYIKAKRMYSRHLHFVPDNQVAYERRALSRLHLKDKVGGINDFTKCMQLAEDEVQKKILQGIIFSEKSNDPAAVAILNEVLKGQESHPTLSQVVLGKAYFERGYSMMSIDTKNSIEDFSRALFFKFPRDYAAYNNMAWCYESNSDIESAITTYTKSLEANPYYSIAMANLSGCLRRAGKKAELEELRLKLETQLAELSSEARQSNAHLYFQLALVLKAQGQVKRAIENLTLVMKLDYDCVYLAYFYRGLCHEQLGDISEAIMDHTTAVKLNPCYVDSISTRAHLHASRREWDKAIKDMELYKSVLPTDTWPYRFTASIYADMLRKDDAIAELRRALVLNPTDTDTLELMGHLNCSFMRLHNAITAYDSCIIINPKHQARKYRAGARFAVGNVQGAIEDYEWYLREVSATDIDVLNNLGFLMARANRFDDALAYLSRALVKEPSELLLLFNRSIVYLLSHDYASATADALVLRASPADVPESARDLVERVSLNPVSAALTVSVTQMRLHFDAAFQFFLAEPGNLPLHNDHIQ